MWESQDKNIQGSRSALHQIPVFISAGEKDNVAKPDMMRSTIAQTKSGDYKTLRSEWRPGGHQVSQEHITTALEWFESFDK
jgi:predicted esterase